MRIGITGGIGSGKSYVSNMLRGLGYEVYDTDSAAKRLMTSDETLIHSLRELIGEDCYTLDGMLNKPVVARYLFSDDSHRQKVNGIVHPAVKKDFREWADKRTADKENTKSETVFMECAILYESRFDDIVDKVVMVWADETTRVGRVMSRDHSTEEEVRRKIASQSDQTSLLNKADFVFDNSVNADTEGELRRLVTYLDKRL